jgi:hypothetical protein
MPTQQISQTALRYLSIYLSLMDLRMRSTGPSIIRPYILLQGINQTTFLIIYLSCKLFLAGSVHQLIHPRAMKRVRCCISSAKEKSNKIQI